MRHERRSRSRSPVPHVATSSMDLDLARVRAVAVEAVLQACQITSHVQGLLVENDVGIKSDRSPVTVADFASQALISHRLYEAFPSIPLMGEEDAISLRQNAALAARVADSIKAVAPELSIEAALTAIDRGSHAGGPGRFWVLDPIDGTKGFLRKEQYAVCLGLIDNGQVLVSVLGCPNLHVDPNDPDGERGCLFVAVRGQGATQLVISTGVESRIAVSQASVCSETMSVESVESSHSNHSRQGRVLEQLNMTRSVRMDSQCKFGVVARGEGSLYLRLSADDTHHKLWDIAAGAMIVEEAGGQVSDSNGRPLDFTLGRTVGVTDLFASNGLIHSTVLEALQKGGS